MPAMSSGGAPPPHPLPPSSAALLGLDEAVLLVASQLHLGVAGAAALVAELHGGPVVVAALLQQGGHKWRGGVSAGEGA